MTVLDAQSLPQYQWGADYVTDWPAFWKAIAEKTIKPYQVEFQPGPTGEHLCWMACPYCYGRSAQSVLDRLPTSRWIELLDNIVEGGVKKLIFAGYATDPLFAPSIQALMARAIHHHVTWGINTKALHIPPNFLAQLAINIHQPGCYISVSVDAGCNATYARVHGLQKTSQAYDRVLANLRLLSHARVASGESFSLGAMYLVNDRNADADNLLDFLNDMREVGCNVVRFAFPQVPRGCGEGDLDTVPSAESRRHYTKRLQALAERLGSETFHVLFADTPVLAARSFPCVARWVFPTIGYDGWLYPCSQSAAPNFRGFALGNLNEQGFWETYYDYTPRRLLVGRKMRETLDCRCDRKAHLLNQEAACKS